MEAVYKLKNLKFRYEQNWVIAGISCEIHKGEVLGIVGPNGSGKTTILKLLSRVIIPEEGEICLRGKNIMEFKQVEIARIVAVVPQQTFFPFPFTVREVVLMGRSPWLSGFAFESQRDKEIAFEAMCLTDIVAFKNRPIFELSEGERQRVIISRALAQEPQVMLLDEPTAHLDIGYQIEIFDLIRKLNKEKGLTVVIISHDLNLASEYCHRLMLLDKGKIVGLGRPEEVINMENLGEVYGTRVLTDRNPVTGAPRITLVSKREVPKSGEKRVDSGVYG